MRIPPPARLVGVLAAALLATAAAPASADVFFDFNPLSDGGSNSSVQSYMRSQLVIQLGAGKTVTVTGSAVEKDYNGDNHVVGPKSGSTVKSLTLGNSDGTVQHGGSPDAYLYNSDSVKITMTFNFDIYGVAFDYEIFPNSTCADPPTTSGCSVWPDFTLKAGTVGPFATYLHTVSVDPYTTPINGYQYSPFSGSTKEKAAQFLGQSGEIILPGVRTLEFYDWPERIGIDNLRLITTPPPVPEPATLLLLGAGLAGAYARRRRQDA
jgi:hypothetical protein